MLNEAKKKVPGGQESVTVRAHSIRMSGQQEYQKGNRGGRRGWRHSPRPWPSEFGSGRGWVQLTEIV